MAETDSVTVYLRDASHVAFADESNWNCQAGRYCSVSVVTAKRNDAIKFHREAQTLLVESGIQEFQWKKLNGAKYRYAAKKLVDLVVPLCRAGKLRVDTVIWDIHDSRHAVPGRDDVANLGRMLFHLLRFVLDHRWPDSTAWGIYPDERSDYDWGPLREALEDKGTQLLAEYGLFAPEGALRLRDSFSILGLRECDSSEYPLIQIADLFAGLGQYSHVKHSAYLTWLATEDDQQALWQADPPKLSNTDRERFPVLRHLDRACKERKLGVSLKSFGGLRTPDPKNPINFWFYEPQHDADHAPTRSS